jgi:hypothetical protein
MMTLAFALAAIALVAALVYWEFVLAEGVHLGPRVVAFLYDWVARRYNSIKQFDPAYEEWFIGEPLARHCLDAVTHGCWTWRPAPGVCRARC